MKKTEDRECGFEIVYNFNRTVSTDRELVGVVRFQAGCELAKIYGIKGDIVVPVPNTAREVAQGYSYMSGIKLSEAMIAKDKLGRSFEQMTQAERERVANEKFIYLPENINGKEIVLIDDSIVRGTTFKNVINKLRELGARKIHVLIASPPVINTCERIQVKDKAELIATNRTVDEICGLIGADSLHYLPLDIAKEVYCRNQNLCLDCFN